jgi:hypothetical protein
MSARTGAHRGAGRYRAMCPCCEPEGESETRQPGRVGAAKRKPLMAWRVRLSQGGEAVVQQKTIREEE